MTRMTDEPLVLGIETSCDETGVGIVRGHTLLADAVASSVEEHARFGGVVPEVASRAHLEAMVPTIERACADAGIRLHDVDAIAVTSGPGLAGALLVGVAAAKALAVGLGKPIYGVNHLAAHVAVDQLEHGPLPEPCVAMLVSGGHSSLLRVSDVTGGDRASSRWARRSTTPPARRSTRSPGCSGCRSPAGRTSTGRPGPARRCTSTSRAASPRGATWSGTGSTSRSPGSRPPSPAGSRPASGAGEPVPVDDVAASFQEAVCDVLTRKAVDAARQRGHRGHPDRRRGGGELPAAGAGRGARRREGHPGPGAAAGAVHRQRRDGRRPRRRDGGPRPAALARSTCPPTPRCRSPPSCA